MHDTHTQIGTRCSKTNINHSNLKLTANQINNTAYSENKTYTHPKVMDNNNNRQKADRFSDGRLKYHWGADDEIMKIINRRDIPPETEDLIERRIELTKPGHMRHQWHKKLERNSPPKRPDDVDRKEIKRIDIRLRRKEENRITHIGGGYFKNFGDEIPQTPGTSAENNRKLSASRKPHQIPNPRFPRH